MKARKISFQNNTVVYADHSLSTNVYELKYFTNDTTERKYTVNRRLYLFLNKDGLHCKAQTQLADVIGLACELGARLEVRVIATDSFYPT